MTPIPSSTLPELNAEEREMVNAFRTGDMKSVCAFFTKQAERLAAASRPAPESNHPARLFLDSAERLSLSIIGALAMRNQLTRLTVNHSDSGLAWLYQDIADSIRDSLPGLDPEEIRRLMVGESAE